MAALIIEVWLGVIQIICTRTFLGVTSLFRNKHNRLLLASAATGILLSLVFGAKAANTEIYQPVQTPTPEQDEAVNQVGGWFYFMNWVDRGMQIRTGGDVRMCLLNLAKALEEVQVLSSAEYNGAAGALSLLPTAGALLGAPTREMWIVYKLVPIAGFLSMFLSMGATITPSDVGEYDSGKAYSYGGMMPTIRTDLNHEKDEDEENAQDLSAAKIFAQRIKHRADDVTGGDIFLKIWFAIFLQLVFIGVVLVAMWFAQRGSVIPWWCRVWGWMYFWYALIIITSVFDNIVAAPFSKSWTIRVSKAPSNIMVDQNQRRLTDFEDPRYPTIMERLKAGVNVQHRITMQEFDPSTYSRTCFYVVVSIEGINAWHAFAQTLSRGCSVAVFAFGTALFASATLMSISAALMLLCLVLPMGVIGRVVAMWIAAEMNRHNPMIIHTVVQKPEEASEHIKAIIELPGLQVEMMGHVILDGKCILKRSPIFSAATYIGLLAKPYNLVARAIKNQRQDSFAMSLMGSKSREKLGRSTTGFTSQRTQSGFDQQGLASQEITEIHEANNK